MQNSSIVSGTAESLPPPPPPPIPPTLNLFNQNCKCKKDACIKETKPLRKSPKEDIIAAVRHVTHNFYMENPSNLMSLYHPVAPVIQEGRCCGIVALSMASQLITDVSADTILKVAKSLNFTKEGEMFSAYNMACLAQTLLKCHAVVIDNLDTHKQDLLSHICDGCPVLIPYDADKNHFPCSNNGVTAHWAVVTGLGFIVGDIEFRTVLKCYELVEEYPELNIFMVEDKQVVKNFLKCSEKVYLYARQGKSKHLAAWDLDHLIGSNKNMYEITKKYNSDELVLPLGDALSELRNKAVLLKKKS